MGQSERSLGPEARERLADTTRLEDLKPNAAVRGVLPDCLVTVVGVQWFGSEALELTYKDPGGRPGNVLLYRHDEPRLEVAVQRLREVGRDMEETGRPSPGRGPFSASRTTALVYWNVVAPFVEALGSVLDHIEGRTRWH